MALPYTFGTQSGSIPLNELDENFQYLENLVPPLAVAAATVTAASQPNITLLGTLSTVSCTGTITSGTVIANLLNGTLQTASQPNITQIGILADLTVSNTLTVGTVTATQLTSVTLGGTLSTAAQPAITSVGTLISVSVTGNVQGGNILTGGMISAAGALVASDANVVTVSASGNITASHMDLASASITGNVTSGNIRTTGLISAAGNITGSNLSISGVATSPTAANGTSNTQIATTAFVQNSLLNILPSGVIVMWSGTVASIPLGWLLCDGTSGTPDLRDRFVVGAGSTYNPAATGGSANAIVVAHTHTASSVVTDPGHAHTYTAPSGINDAGFSGSVVNTTVSTTTGTATTGITVATTVNSTGSSGTNANLPPYYALAYIMKA